jgi:dTDP-4-dehydrorhamnose 3,5-epimerase
MGTTDLSDILITKLSKIEIDKGNVMHAIKANDSGYVGFGEAYFSLIKKNEIKGWKLHNKMVMNLVVPIGNVKFVFYQKNKDSLNEFRVESIGEDNYCRLTVPTGIWFGFQGLSEPINVVLNISNIEHNANEQENMKLSDKIFNW